MDNSSIAVLIASYNSAQFLDVALQGIAWQTLPATEVIIVDDCSNDRTIDVVNSWSDRLPIKYFRNEVNLGVGPSRNVGLGHVDSSLVAVLDADDLWLPSHLETLVGSLLDDHTIVSPRAAVWSEGIGLSLDNRYASEVPKAKNQFEQLARENFVFGGSLFPMSMIQEIGNFPNVRIAEDHLLWLRAVANGYVIEKPQLSTVLYRRRKGSLSEIKSSFFQALQNTFLENLGGFNAGQQKILQRHIRDLRMREHLSLHDERSGRLLPSIFSNLVPVIFRASLRLKLSAIVRLFVFCDSLRYQ